MSAKDCPPLYLCHSLVITGHGNDALSAHPWAECSQIRSEDLQDYILSLWSDATFSISFPLLRHMHEGQCGHGVMPNDVLGCEGIVITSWCGTALSISAHSAGVRETLSAAKFSSKQLTRLVPGMGMTSSPRASTHASASWPGVQPFLAASSLTLSTSFMFCRET